MRISRRCVYHLQATTPRFHSFTPLSSSCHLAVTCPRISQRNHQSSHTHKSKEDIISKDPNGDMPHCQSIFGIHDFEKPTRQFIPYPSISFIMHSCHACPITYKLIQSAPLVVVFSFQKDVGQDITQRQNPLQTAVLVNNYQPVYP